MLWGWKLHQASNKFDPIMTDQPAAPDDMLKFVRCKCTKGCTAALCSCRKNGLFCVSACAHCRGDQSEGCTNAEPARINNDSLSTDSEFDGDENYAVTSDSNVAEFSNFLDDMTQDDNVPWISDEVTVTSDMLQ